MCIYELIRLWLEAMRRRQVQPQPPAPVAAMKVGITAFGRPIDFRMEDAVAEFKAFVEAHSPLRLNVHFVQEGELSESELFVWDKSWNCSFLTPWSLSPEHKAKMPTGMKSNIVVYDPLGQPQCFAGGSWGKEYGYITVIPFSADWTQGWRTNISGALVHEFIHDVQRLLVEMGYGGFPDIDRAADYGYTPENDVGWRRFLAWALGHITPEMAARLHE